MLSLVSELRPLQLLSYLAIFSLFQLADAKRDLKSACLTCQQITENFNKVTEEFLKASGVLIDDDDDDVCSCLPLQLISFCILTLYPVVCTFYLFFFFLQGIERTAKQNFGGGNTAWEERKLSKYETR